MIGLFKFHGYNGVDGAFVEGLVVEFRHIRTGAVQTGEMPTDIVILTKPQGEGQSTAFRFDSKGNFVLADAAIATTATDRFAYITSCAGPPTGTPTAYTGRVPMVYDSTNNEIYFYNGAWRSVVVA